MSTSSSGRPAALRRELRIVDAAAFSIGLIGPVGAMAVNGVGAAGLLGTGATWAFLFALAGVVLVAYGFVHLSRHISHSGSVFALVGLTLGPRAGFVAGCALAGAYLTIGAGSTIAISLFFTQVLDGIGVSGGADWLLVAVLATAVVAALSLSNIRLITKTLLVVEILGAGLVLLLAGVILVKLALGHAPAGQSLDWSFLDLPAGTSISTIGSAAVFGFLAFAGFEGAATLGEETRHPRRDVPRAIVIAIIVVAAFYLISIAAQSLGFGTDPAGVEAFKNTPSAYGQLAAAYLGAPLAVALNLAAALSSLAITLGTINASARIVFAVGRDAGDTKITTRLNRKGEPAAALAIALAAALVIMVGQRLAGTAVLDAVLYWLTLGTISLLVAYALATCGAIKFLFLSGRRDVPAWQIVVPVLALAFIGYVIYRNAVGVAAPYDRFPYLVAGWVALAAIVAYTVPGLAGRVRANLERDADGNPSTGSESAAAAEPDRT